MSARVIVATGVATSSTTVKEVAIVRRVKKAHALAVQTKFSLPSVQSAGKRDATMVVSTMHVMAARSLALRLFIVAIVALRQDATRNAGSGSVRVAIHLLFVLNVLVSCVWVAQIHSGATIATANVVLRAIIS
jgi:hypothetical protein